MDTGSKAVSHVFFLLLCWSYGCGARRENYFNFKGGDSAFMGYNLTIRRSNSALKKSVTTFRGLNSLLFENESYFKGANSSSVSDTFTRPVLASNRRAPFTAVQQGRRRRSAHQMASFLPGIWRQICSQVADEESLISALHVQQHVLRLVRTRLRPYRLICLVCHVTTEHRGVTYDDVRTWSRGLDTDVRVLLSIGCDSGSNLTFSFPGRAHHLVFLSISGCGLHGFHDELLDRAIDQQYPDLFLVHAIRHVTIYLDAYDEAGRNAGIVNISRSGKCGAEHALVKILSAMSYSYTLPSPDKMAAYTKLLLSSSKTYFRDVAKITVQCNYSNLLVLDNSVYRHLDANFDDVLLHNSVYPKLELLNLSHVRLDSLPQTLANWRLHFPALTLLDISHNNISDVSNIRDMEDPEKKAVGGVVDVSHNNITVITPLLLQRLATHRSVVVNISHNPFNCNCEMKTFIAHAQKNYIQKLLPGYSYLRDLTCWFPVSMRDAIILDQSQVDLGCFVRTQTVLTAPVISLALTLVVLLLLVGLALRFRKEIVILSFTRLHILLPCQGAQHEADKEFDAFVAYSEEDASWVTTVVKFLEEPRDHNRPAFRLCLHHRDFQIGVPIADNIVRSIEASRHTILVLSPSFLESHWCLMEFRMAFHQTLLEKKRHLIIVTREQDKLGDDVDADLKRCLQTLTYIRANDRLFFDKVVFALSDKGRRSGLTNSK